MYTIIEKAVNLVTWPLSGKYIINISYMYVYTDCSILVSCFTHMNEGISYRLRIVFIKKKKYKNISLLLLFSEHDLYSIYAYILYYIHYAPV